MTVTLSYYHSQLSSEWETTVFPGGGAISSVSSSNTRLHFYPYWDHHFCNLNLTLTLNLTPPHHPPQNITNPIIPLSPDLSPNPNL